MASKNALCRKIEAILPDVGRCGVDFDVNFDPKAKAWAIDFHRGQHHLRTFVEEGEAESCLGHNMCLPLGLQMGQLRANYEKYIHEHSLKDT